jgi:hypothetical protein
LARRILKVKALGIPRCFQEDVVMETTYHAQSVLRLSTGAVRLLQRLAGWIAALSRNLRIRLSLRNS